MLLKVQRPVLVHGSWILAATVSFIVGYKFFPAGSDPAGGGEERRKVLEFSANSPGSKKGIAPVNGQGVDDGNGLDRSRGREKVELSDLDIESLGTELKSTSPIERRLAFSRLLGGLTAENALLIRDQIKHFKGDSAEFREFHYAWGAVGGTDAVMFGADTVEPDMSPALSGWASSDPQKAIAWFEALDMENDSSFDPLLKDRKMKADDLRNYLMGGLVQGLSDTDPALAIDFVHEMLGSGNKAAHHVAHAPISAMIRTSSPIEAAQWANSLQEGPVRDQAMGRVADNFARKDPKAAAEWAEGLSDQPESAGVFSAVGRNWASRDPEAAMDWLGGLPEGGGQNAGMRGALSSWAGRDPAEASKYLVEMPVSESRDAAIRGFTERLAWEDPQAAITWAESISSEEVRHAAMTRAGQAWARQDARAAADWAVSSTLPEQLQEAIRNPQNRNRLDE